MLPALEPSVQDHLRLEAFEGKFDVKEFVGGISEKLIAQSKADPGPFDPKPFIRTFEAAVDKLIAVRKDVQAKTEQMEKSVRIAERDYSKKMAELNRGFEAVGQSFSGMETKMNEVGRTAIRIGEQMESVHQQRQRAQAAYDLIDFYNQFAKDDTSRLDAMKKEGKDGRRKVAVLLRRLATVAKEVDLPHSEKTRENIDRYCEKFEKDILHLFDRAYRRGDPKMMHHCAQTLLDFNGGTSCVQVYVNQHDFFINRVRADPNIDSQLWVAIADPDAPPPTSERGLQELFQEIRTTVGQEAQIVQAVFPNPAYVMQVFLQRVFAQSVQQHLEQLIVRTDRMPELAFLRILQLVHQSTSVLVEDMKAYELPSVIPKSPVDASEFQRTIKGMPATNASNTATAATISTMLETAMEELFVPYTEGQRYLEKESRSLSELYTGYLARFTRYHERVDTKGKSSVFGRMVDQLSAAAATTSPSGTSTTSAQAAAALMRIGGLSASTDKTQRDSTEDPIREEDGLLSVDVAEKMLKWHAEAIGRCVELSPTNDVPKHTFALLRVLAAAIGSSYIEVAVETVLARLETADSKVEPSLQPLTVLREVDLICHLWQRYVTMALLPLASSSVTTRREMVIFNNQAVSRIEGGANAVTQKLTDAIVNWLSTQLAKQKRTDFKPKNDDISFARVNTEPCLACCDMLEKVRDAAKANLSGKNLEVFLTEVGVAFHGLLLDHLKKFPVSATGGLMLAKDLKSYQDVIDSFSIPSLHERFEFIRQLGNVFLVKPDILKSYITEGYLGRIDANLLRPYLAQRADWGQAEKGFNDPTDGPADGKVMRDRFGMGRLSMIMKDLEPLREQIAIPSMPMTGISQFTGNITSSFANARSSRFSNSGTS
ncbi:exocyst complex component Sec10 [Dichomitus squalens]|uniref:Exocyst complex component Sec10 n=1 Tax=Dichomitus squalens TaxID=114155 RepID=A0A4Q9P5S5_9APHY|nr:exocyst complex component Sec10 [Dichomitus squalens LYAD-421 SS1]EJF62829.1 exocyst complex component Sec10 [Dichomitus squalens LYAD-421 SS1]TBU49035.1 exocyst complex component Sec10 [Dichomitus squalens]TBU64126.1 exocyst complex component Sec10 [Dichomitus squalens]